MNPRGHSIRMIMRPFLCFSIAASVYAVPCPMPLNSNAAYDSGTDDFAQVATDGQGIWVTVWMSLDDLGGTIGTDRDILFARSTDDGATWSAAAPLNTNAATDVLADQWPDVATDRQGTWLAVWSYGPSANRDIVFSLSTDAGATWTDPTLLDRNAVNDTANDERPRIATDGRGTWLVVWSSSEPGADSDLHVARSTDGGGTWTTPVALNSNSESDSGNDIFASMASDEAGTWVVAWQSKNSADGSIGPDYDIWFSRSTDSGLTWTAPQPLNSGAGSDFDDDVEPHLTTDGNGNWVAVWRSGFNLDELTIQFSRSIDHAMSWSTQAPVTSNDGRQLSPQITTDRQGTWVGAWSSDSDAPGGGVDSDILFSVSTDVGFNWSDAQPLNSNADVDSGGDFQPQLVTDLAGKWLAVWTSTDSLGGLIGIDSDLLVAEFQFVSESCSCPADFAFSGVVDAADLALLLGNWGSCAAGPCATGDLNNDFAVNASDLALLLASWGPCE